MNENQIEEVFKELKRSSRVSITLVLVGVVFLLGSVYYSATRLRPLEDEIKKKRQEIISLQGQEEIQRKKVDEKRKEFEQLRANVEKLYSVRVTPSNDVYELKATAKATGRKLTSGEPIYDFNIYINAAPDVLNKIQRVVYTFDHPTFDNKQKVAESVKSHFQTGYTGWGCLTRVDVKVELKGGNKTHLDFDMCKSLGPQWQ
jgi:hypothetical protein